MTRDIGKGEIGKGKMGKGKMAIERNRKRKKWQERNGKGRKKWDERDEGRGKGKREGK